MFVIEVEYVSKSNVSTMHSLAQRVVIKVAKMRSYSFLEPWKVRLLFVSTAIGSANSVLYALN